MPPGSLIKHMLVAMCVPISIHATTATCEEPESGVPSAALLEFLAEFGALDESTFELIVFHGLDDADKAKQSAAEHDQNKQGSAEVIAEQEGKNGSQ